MQQSTIFKEVLEECDPDFEQQMLEAATKLGV